MSAITANEDENPNQMKLRIGMPDGHVESIKLTPNAPLRIVVEEIRARATIDPTKTRIRLISAGRLLSDMNAPVNTLLANDDFVHIALSEALPAPVPTSPDSPSTSLRPAVVITTGATDANGSEVRIVLHDFGEQATERLTRAGFTTAEATALAAQLRRVRDEMEELRSTRNAQGRSGGRRNELAGEEATTLTIAGAVDGTNTDFLMGCICGYLLGVLVLAMLLDKNITRRWRVGIVAGVATNCAFGILRSTLYLQNNIA